MIPLTPLRPDHYLSLVPPSKVHQRRQPPARRKTGLAATATAAATRFRCCFARQHGSEKHEVLERVLLRGLTPPRWVPVLLSPSCTDLRIAWLYPSVDATPAAKPVEGNAGDTQPLVLMW